MEKSGKSGFSDLIKNKKKAKQATVGTFIRAQKRSDYYKYLIGHVNVLTDKTMSVADAFNVETLC